MFSKHSAFAWLNRFARVQFLGLVALMTAVMLPAWARADDQAAPTDLPEDQPSELTNLPEQTNPPVLEPAPTIDEAIAAQLVEAQVNRIIKSVVEAAQSLARTASADAGDVQLDENAESVVPDSSPPDQLPPSEVKTAEAEIDSLSAQIEQEKIESARRLAELEGQLSEARDQLATLTGTDGQGFIRAWLVLGPIRVDEKVLNHDEESNKELLDREYVPAKTTPKAGDEATVDDVDLTWKAAKSPDYFVDLGRVVSDQELDAEQAAYLGVAYVTSEEEVTGVKLSIGSDDDSVWRLNGKEVIRSYGGRGVDKDQDSADDLTLKQGVNVLTFTVLNGQGATAAAARFVDEDGNPIKGLKVSLTPPTQPVVQTDIRPEGDAQEQK